MEGLLEGGGGEKRVDAYGRQGDVAGKLVADVTRLYTRLYTRFTLNYTY
jgi:hypothetical protein